MSKALAAWREIWEDAVDFAVQVREDVSVSHNLQQSGFEHFLLGQTERPPATAIRDPAHQASECRRHDICRVRNEPLCASRVAIAILACVSNIGSTDSDDGIIV
jgi:hypothetical protein